MLTDIKVTSWNELNDRLFVNSWKESLQRFRSTVAYRGTTTVYANLASGLQKLGGSYEKVETHLLRNFRKYASSSEVTEDSVWNWMALGQHHGLPTRMIDWTYSPYVALHFATRRPEAFDQDGTVWCVDFTKTNHFLPKNLKQLLKEEGSYVFTAEILNQAARSLAAFDKLQTEPFLAFFEPPSLDQRIINQFALFSLMSNPKTDMLEWLEQKEDVFIRIIIPAALKQEVRDKLDQANITERVLFPGLDGLSAWLQRYYKPKEVSLQTTRSTPSKRFP